VFANVLVVNSVWQQPMVEMRGIEPRSIAVVMFLLRVYPVKAFYSAPELATGS